MQGSGGVHSSPLWTVPRLCEIKETVVIRALSLEVGWGSENPKRAKRRNPQGLGWLGAPSGEGWGRVIPGDTLGQGRAAQSKVRRSSSHPEVTCRRSG